MARVSKSCLLARESLKGFEYRLASRNAHRKSMAVRRARRRGAFDHLEHAEQVLAGLGLSPGKRRMYGMTFLRVLGVEFAYTPDGKLSWQRGIRAFKSEPIPQMDLFTAELAPAELSYPCRADG